MKTVARWTVLVLMIAAAGCGYVKKKTGFMEPTDYDSYNVPAEFEPYVVLFIKESEIRNPKLKLNAKPLKVKFGPLAKDVLGQCQLYYNAPPEITIDPAKWNGTEDCFKEILMMHELGHCKLKRDHDEVILGNGLKESLMYPSHIGCYRYVPNREYYLNELFSKHDDIQFGLFDE